MPAPDQGPLESVSPFNGNHQRTALVIVTHEIHMIYMEESDERNEEGRRVREWEGRKEKKSIHFTGRINEMEEVPVVAMNR